jgi:16S rRNA (guanine966-N2)-methyltransferase
MSSLRITGGELRGRKVSLPAHGLRPTSSRARQAFFNIVSLEVPGSTFLDLFAGSGIFALEAVSRGAESAIAIEQAPGAAAALSKLAVDWNVPLRVIASDVFAGLKRLEHEPKIDLVYADPPYDFDRYRSLLDRLDGLPALAESATIAIEHRKGRLPFPVDGLTRLRYLRTAAYGEVAFSLFEAAPSGAAEASESVSGH